MTTTEDEPAESREPLLCFICGEVSDGELADPLFWRPICTPECWAGYLETK